MKRRGLHINGIVQGVGFRPFVAQTALALKLKGFVRNTSDGVWIEIEGSRAQTVEFERQLHADAPPLAKIISVTTEDLKPSNTPGFEIRASVDSVGNTTLVPPDAATCADCLGEVRDPTDRRYGYPFTNCTNCGPRWTIIAGIPYDRPRTSMDEFTMCAACQAEYDDLSDRRFHAQPNACSECGPRVWLEGPVGALAESADPIGQAAEVLARHGVLAVRGLGGFQLAVRADAATAVRALRQRKRRSDKPLAVMVPDLTTARKIAMISDAEATELLSAAAPIVLVQKRDKPNLAVEIAPGHRRVGLMLPATPLHHLLFDALAEHQITSLVMTSGNASEEPICRTNAEAKKNLAAIADVYLLHDREVLRRADDSVVQVIGDQRVVLRRARGLAPVPINLQNAAEVPPILAVGTQMKNTVCVLKDGRAFLSPHVGDLGNLAADRFFDATITTLQDVLECQPQIVAHDLHPAYTATTWAQEKQRQDPDLTLVGVQHHHAHLAAVMAEHQLTGKAVGLIMDGTGYGTDGTIWGGEVLVGDAREFTRVGHLEPVPLPGGDAAIKAPWRQAVSYLRHTFGPEFFTAEAAEFPFQADRPIGPVLEMLDRGLNSPLTSSCGRLFDAVAAIVGPWSEATYEAQAAIEFAALTSLVAVQEAQPFALAVEDLQPRLTSGPEAGPLLMPVRPVIRAVREARRAGLSPSIISAMFHRTLIEVFARTANWAASHYDLKDVVLAGGVFQNEILLAGLRQRLHRDGLRPLCPEQVPPGDGAVSLGQVAIAAARFERPATTQNGDSHEASG